MLMKLTDRQEQVLRAIAQAIKEDARPPSIPELMSILGVSSPNGIAKHLKILEAKGYISREKGSRGIRLLDQAKTSLDANYSIKMISGRLTDNEPLPDAAYVPLIGNIAAGSPILAEEHVEEVIPVPCSMTESGSDTFFLRVKGDSMIEEGIMPGDLVMISKCDSVANGELAAVMVEDEATVKRFYKQGSRVVLEPANPNYEPIIIEAGTANCAVVGKVVGLLRSYKRKF